MPIRTHGVQINARVTKATAGAAFATHAVVIESIVLDGIHRFVDPSIATTSLANAMKTVIGSLSGEAEAPINKVLPVFTGVVKVGTTLTVNKGTWEGTAPITYAYQWKAAGTDITGATSTTYVPVSGDIGKTITVSVTATNTQGSGTAVSVARGPVVA